MGELIELFGEKTLTPQARASIEDRLTHIAIEISLLESERERLEGRL